MAAIKVGRPAAGAPCDRQGPRRPCGGWELIVCIFSRAAGSSSSGSWTETARPIRCASAASIGSDVSARWSALRSRARQSAVGAGRRPWSGRARSGGTGRPARSRQGRRRSRSGASHGRGAPPAAGVGADRLHLLASRRQQLLGLVDGDGEADSVRLRCVDRERRQRQVERITGADHARQPWRATVRRKGTEARLWELEARLLAGEDEVDGTAQQAAEADRDAVDRGDHRLE